MEDFFQSKRPARKRRPRFYDVSPATKKVCQEKEKVSELAGQEKRCKYIIGVLCLCVLAKEAHYYSNTSVRRKTYRKRPNLSMILSAVFEPDFIHRFIHNQTM